MKYRLLCLFLFCVLDLFGQTIEEYFKENKIPELYVPFTVDDDGRFVFLKRKNTMRRMSIALFEKRDSTWISDERRSGKTDIPLENIAWVLDSLPSGSKIIHMGLSTYRSQRASFKIPEDYKVGDTLSFKFCILAGFDYGGFHPKVYLSKRYFITRRGKEFFKDNWVYAGPLPVASRNTRDLQEVEISIILTKKLKKLRWIHIQNNMWRDEFGYLLPYSLKDVQRIIEDTVTSTKDSANVKVYFENDSYALSDEAKEAIRDLMLMTKSENNIYERV